MKTILLASFLAATSLAIAEPQKSKIELEGQIQSLPSQGHVGEWKVGNKTVHVSADTLIKEEDGKIAVGKKVEVKGFVEENGNIKATKIETDN